MQRKIWLSLALAGFLAMGCRPDPEVGDALCSDGVDNDEDGNIDCADVGCVDEPSCTAEICTDGADNDGDQLIDCADTQDCGANAACVEANCGDGVDNDNDTLIDCADVTDCGANPLCQDDCGNNTIDAGEDCDGNQLGGEDCTTIPGGFTGGTLACNANCDFNTAGCQGGAVEDCDNGIDDDGDNFIDCDDFGCEGDPACPPELQEDNCTNGLDDDGDSFIDCLDFDCGNDQACNTEICNNNIDDDGDTFVDCDDFGCGADPACAEADEARCTDTLDNDNDGFADCVDRGCDVAATCIALEVCNDNIDNDTDGRTDCADGSCANNAACNAGAVQIQQIQNGSIASGTVTVNNVFVTAVRVNGANSNLNIIVQEPQGETIGGVTYPQFSGVQLFINAATATALGVPANLQPGDCVSVSGTVSEFNAGTQISTLTAFTRNANAAQCGAVPQPFVSGVGPIATDTDLNTAGNQNGVDAEAFEFVLVQVNNFTIATAPDGAGDVNGTQAGSIDILNIDNFLFSGNNATAIALSAGEVCSSILGVYGEFVNGGTSKYHLQPRGAADITNCQ